MYNVNEIKKFIHEREKGRLKIFEEVLAKCYHRIQTSVMRDEPFAVFIVPDFLIGKPKYNFANCIEYIIFRLKQNGFELKYFYPNALQIHWGKTDFHSMLSIENDRGTFNQLAIENKPSIYPPLFDMKAPHSGENLGLFSKKTNQQKKSLDLESGKFMGSLVNSQNKDEMTFKFRGQEEKKKMIQEEKFRAINNFLPRTNVFSSLDD